MSQGYARALKGKIKITATLRVLSGLHIGASNEFSSIGAVDSVVVRDPLTRLPVIPGSSLKGKMRHLLARAYPGAPFYEIKKEPEALVRLFGGTVSGKDGGDQRMIMARLQFADLFMNKESAERISRMNTDLYLTEIKFENTINRITGEANPRQMERVPAGAEFDFILIYNIEEPEELEADFEQIATGLELVQMDYLGGGGTRGNGRVILENFSLQVLELGEKVSIETERLKSRLEETKNYALLSV